MDLPDTVTTKGKAGKLEVRAVDSRGSFVMYRYLDPKSMKPADKKRKLVLKDQNEKISEYFIIPLKDAKRSLLVTAESEEKERQVWNEAVGRAEEVWKS